MARIIIGLVGWLVRLAIKMGDISKQFASMTYLRIAKITHFLSPIGRQVAL